VLAETGNRSRPVQDQLVDLGAVARQTVGMFSGVAEERGISLSVAVTEPASTHGDAVDFRRLVSNLLDNAIRFTPPGGDVGVAVTGSGDETTLVVTDTGSGINAADLDHVFDRFFKADPSRTHGGSGRSSGLGLAICRSIAEASGGTISIASRPGAGTRVSVCLPGADLRPSPLAADGKTLTPAQTAGA
jgi:signal transduction histidine kinase